MTNEFVINSSNINGFDFLYMPLPDENIWETNERLKLTDNKRFLGFKPYPDLKGVKGNEIRIYDFLNKSVLEFSNENELIIILHLPRKDRLRSKDNVNEIIEILKKYKKIKLILAHIGRSFCVNDMLNNIDLIKDYNNLFFDIALINEYQVFELLFKKVDINKIMFGTDYPLGLLKGKDICINNNHYYVTKEIYGWGLGPLQPSLVDFTLYVYEEIRSLLCAINNVKTNKVDECLNKIFYENLKREIINSE